MPIAKSSLAPPDTAAAVMLDGTLPEDYVAEWTAHFAARREPPATGLVSLLVFRINADWFALPMSTLVEVMERRPVHSLPHLRSPSLKGVVNFRGQLLLCISLTQLLHLGQRTDHEKSSHTTFERLLVIGTPQGPLTIPVSEVAGSCRRHAGELQAPPATLSHDPGHFTRAVLTWKHQHRAAGDTRAGTVSVGMLDTTRLFDAIHKGFS